MEMQFVLGRALKSEHVLLIGDFNSLAPGISTDLSGASPDLAFRLSDLDRAPDCTPLSMAIEAGFALASRAEPTSPTSISESGAPEAEPPLALDHVLATKGLAERLLDASVWRMSPANLASDHFPIVVDFDITFP
jgi:endonuclease/exonuclease/phosphatase family metal-dependent hydrolase